MLQGSELGPVLFVIFADSVSRIISRHSSLHESLIAHETLLHRLAPIAEIDTMISRRQGCIADLKDWMTTKKLQLNDEKMELMIESPKETI